jgi:hypothetical protein
MTPGVRTMTDSALRVAITNVYGGGDYTAPIAH